MTIFGASKVELWRFCCVNYIYKLEYGLEWKGFFRQTNGVDVYGEM